MCAKKHYLQNRGEAAEGMIGCDECYAIIKNEYLKFFGREAFYVFREHNSEKSEAGPFPSIPVLRTAGESCTALFENLKKLLKLLKGFEAFAFNLSAEVTFTNCPSTSMPTSHSDADPHL